MRSGVRSNSETNFLTKKKVEETLNNNLEKLSCKRFYEELQPNQAKKKFSWKEDDNNISNYN